MCLNADQDSTTLGTTDLFKMTPIAENVMQVALSVTGWVLRIVLNVLLVSMLNPTFTMIFTKNADKRVVTVMIFMLNFLRSNRKEDVWSNARMVKDQSMESVISVLTIVMNVLKEFVLMVTVQMASLRMTKAYVLMTAIKRFSVILAGQCLKKFQTQTQIMRVNLSQLMSLNVIARLDSIGIMMMKNACLNVKSVSILMVINALYAETTVLYAIKRQENAKNAMIWYHQLTT